MGWCVGLGVRDGTLPLVSASGPPHGGLSLQQSSLHLSLRTPGVRKQNLPAFLKARLETRSHHISLLSSGTGQPQIQRMEE